MLDPEYSRFSRNKCDVIHVDFSQYASINSNFTAFYEAFKRYIHLVLCPRCSIKGLKAIAVKRGFSSLNERLLEIMLTDLLRSGNFYLIF